VSNLRAPPRKNSYILPPGHFTARSFTSANTNKHPHQTNKNILKTLSKHKNKSTMAIKPISVEPVAVPEGSGVNFGAVISDIDIENLSGKQQTMQSKVRQ
jgi:hypothetical protein